MVKIYFLSNPIILMNKTKLSYIYAGLAVFFWATVPTAFKVSLGEINILTMLTIASITSATVLMAVVVIQKKTTLIRLSSSRELLNSAILGLINPFIYYLILLKAYSLLPGQVAQPLNMIWPIIMVFISVPLLGQTIERKSFLALLISFIGVYLISSQGKLFQPGHANLTGVLLASGSSIFWAFYFILNVRDKRDEAVKLLLNFLFGSAYLLIAMTVTGKWQAGISLTGALSSVYIGVFEMGITFLFWLKALQMAVTTAKVGNLVYMAPFFSLVFLHFIIHEPIYFTTPIGLLFIISGIFVQSYKTKPAV
jgi:drug/metabolite transporter (DMT)-like permease